MQAPSLFGPGESPNDGAPSADTGVSDAPHSASAPRGSTSLYRKYRPSSFNSIELVGQDHIVKTLRNAVALDRVAHAYLFCGPRGTGKTTTARLLAKAVNCLDPDPARRPCNACPNCLAINAGASPDIIEIDAASNRGIDDIRDLRDRIRFAPAQLPSKVYIIDEAHQITGAAANAFLKTLEEPPAHSRFILATTDPEELLPTIVSRCQRFEFRRIAAADMVQRLRTVADLEGIPVDDEALEMMARHATGSLRDGLGLLEQLALQASAPDQEPSTITANDVRAALGLSRNERVEAIVQALAEHNPGAALGIIQEAVDDGEDPRQLNRQLVGYLRLLLLERSAETGNADERARQLAGKFSLVELAQLARRFSEIDFNIKHAPYPQLPLEVAVVEATSTPAEASPSPASPPRDVRSSAPPEEPGNTPRPTPLRDRVRNTAATRDASAPPLPAAVQPNPVTPLRPNQASSTQGVGRDITVEQIADLWPAVRADVKALNRRIEALLSEVDPVAISGNQITLAVPYPFHRDKLNSDEVRETVSSVLSRLLDRPVTLHCILRGEVVVSQRATSTLPNAWVPPEPQDDGDPTDIEVARVQARVRAAKNIFDADEIDTSEVQPVPGNSTSS